MAELKIEQRTRARVHTVYKTEDGTRVPGVTTVIGVLNKPALVDWAWREGLAQRDYKATRDTAASIGTLLHYLIMCDLTGQTPETDEYSKADIDKAETCLIKWWDWKDVHTLEAKLVETPLVSDVLGFGGTPDWFGLLDAVPTLLDFKTGKGIYPEYFIQLAAYQALLRERGFSPQSLRILRLGRDESEGFEERVILQIGKQWQVFQHCLAIYQLQKDIKKEGI